MSFQLPPRPPTSEMTTTTTTTGAQDPYVSVMTAPIQETTVLPPHKRQTSIEGMDALLIDKNQRDDNLTEAEKRMKEEELSFYSASENEHGDDNIWGLLSGVGGNIYEWYDFAVYGLLAPEIGAAFFPEASAKLQLINSFGVYLAAFIMRPVGAILFGEIGDRLVGRKHALVFSILLITIPSILMGLLPGYSTWGMVSPILLVILRMFQGLSVGGQLAGSYVLSIEQSSSSTRGFRGSVCDASSVGGFMLASAVTAATRWVLTPDQVNGWGWRLPFLFSLLLAPLLYYVVNHAEESKLWAERSEQKELEQMIREQEYSEKQQQSQGIDGVAISQRPAVFDLLDSPFRRRQLAGMIGVMSGLCSSFYVLFLWTPVYLSEIRGLMTEAHADCMNFIVVGIYIILLLISGKSSDGFQHRTDLMKIGLPGIIVACPTMFALFESESWVGIFIGQLLFAGCLSMVQGCIAAFEVELWMADPTLSFTGVAVGHNLAATIFGGTMPLVATGLYYWSIELVGDSGYDDIWLKSLLPRLIPGLYVSILATMSLVCVSFVTKHPHDVRTGNPELRKAVEAENRKFKAALKAKKKKREQMKNQMLSGDGLYIPPTTT